MEVRYGGFWARFLAYIIDKILLGIFETIIFIVVALIIGMAIPFINEPETGGSFVRFAMQTDYHYYDFYSVGFLGLFGTISLVVEWLYFALLQSSPKQATFGKAALGLIVVDENFAQISFGRATVRYFSKYISGLILYIGYIMAAFTREKRALHDIIAGTYVVYER